MGQVPPIQFRAMSNRRYGEDEAREIFSLATTGDARGQALPAESGGLTLDELQRIGEEAGIEPARVAEAAAALDIRGKAAPVRRMLGLPIGVSRVVDLPRAPTDREWEQLVSEFRTTFGSHGVATTSGGIRDWSVGNLHISVEPTANGEQLRLTTRNEAAVALNGLGILMGGMSVLMTAGVAAAGKLEKALPLFVMLGGISLAAFVTNLIRSPRWARERERQMEALAQRAVKLLSPP
jgi:hypothetical protein